MSLDRLRRELEFLSPGPVVDKAFESTLSLAWTELELEGSHKTTPDKLWGRTEKMEWNSPFLTFVLERH
jgi:hypothetical protein